MLLTLMMNLSMFGPVPPGPGTGIDGHDGPPPEFLNWANKERKKLFDKIRTRKQAVERLSQIAEEVSKSATDEDKKEIFEFVQMPALSSIDIDMILRNIGLIERLLVLYDRIRQEQEIVMLLMDD